VFGSNVLDDKKISWCAPGDCTGKVFVKIRELNSNTQDTSDLTYDDVEHFLRFVDKYVSRAVGNNTYARWKKLHQTKTLLDKISASDIATLLLCMKTARRCGKMSCSSRLVKKQTRKGRMRNDVIIPGITREEVNALKDTEMDGRKKVESITKSY
jgi:hypothetical protein